jgi:hypothetical protein
LEGMRALQILNELILLISVFITSIVIGRSETVNHTPVSIVNSPLSVFYP